MKNYFEKIYKGEKAPLLVVLALNILSIPYLFIVKLRAWLYKRSIFKTNKLDCPVISVGNITLGGTGKTPVVEYIARFFIEKGFKPLILARGYGRAPKLPVDIVSDGENILLTHKEAGDEPCLLAENNRSLPVIVGKNRCQAGLIAIEKFKPDIIILDDGFQHLSLARNLNIALLNSIKPFGNGNIFPAGNLREPVNSLNRADIIIYTHSDESNDKNIENLYLQKGVPKFKTVHAFDKLVGVKDKKEIAPEELINKKVVIFCGIGEPESFRNKIEQTGAEVVYYKNFADHYKYSSGDIKVIRQTAEKLKADFVLTTQKDAVKIKEIASTSSLFWYARMKIEFTEGEDTFHEALLSYVENRS